MMKRGPLMVDVTPKPIVHRQATATGRILLKEETIERIKSGEIEKGDPISTAKLAAILAAKATSDIIPLCHLIPLTSVQVEEKLGKKDVTVTVTVKATAKTGVEMEALTAVSAALLTVWDMAKQYEKDEAGQYPTTRIEGIRVVEKTKEDVDVE